MQNAIQTIAWGKKLVGSLKSAELRADLQSNLHFKLEGLDSSQTESLYAQLKITIMQSYEEVLGIFHKEQRLVR